MWFNKYPIGETIQFPGGEGDPTILSESDYYWIGDVNVSTNKDLHKPYLQTASSQYYREIWRDDNYFISPNGNFNMKINSPEFYNSLNDYKFKINNGYIWKKDYIFIEFVKDMFNLRLKYPKTDPMNMIAKLLMNSLYGRFAMKPITNVQGFFTKTEFLKLVERFEILEYIDLKQDESSLFVN